MPGQLAMHPAFIGKPGLGRLQSVHDMIRCPFEPGPDVPGQLLGNTRHLGGMGVNPMPDTGGRSPSSASLAPSCAGARIPTSARLRAPT